MTKTNAMRLLDAANIPFTLFEYPSDDPKQTAEDVARHVGLPPEQVFKTLTVRGEKRGILVFCIPANASLNLKKAAAAAGDKKLEMLPQKELLGATGYIHGGCSPIGMKKKYPTYIDETCLLCGRIAVSGGQRGLQLVIEPEALIRYTDAVVCDVT